MGSPSTKFREVSVDMNDIQEFQRFESIEMLYLTSMEKIERGIEMLYLTPLEKIEREHTRHDSIIY